MIKEKERPKDWVTGDTFYYKIENSGNDNLDGNYFIFNKIRGLYWSKTINIPVFHVKFTKDRKLPTTKEELEKLDYLKTGVTVWERRFIPYNETEIKEKYGDVKFYPDEFGNLSEYLISIIITRKSSVPDDLHYLGNFILENPKDEYIPFTDHNITEFDWDYTKEFLAICYKEHYLRTSPFYVKEEVMKIRKVEREINEFKEEYSRRLDNGEDPDKVLKELVPEAELQVNLGFGVKLYDNDICLDVKDYYNEVYEKGMSGDEITEKVADHFKCFFSYPDDLTFFSLALADLEMKSGVLTAEIKDLAYKTIELDLPRWNKEDAPKRKKELDKLKKRLDEYKI